MLNEQKTEYTFSEDEMALLREIDAAVRELNQQHQGALRMIMKQNKLDGDWQFQGDKLVCLALEKKQ
jgi:hypothetical protein